MNRRKKTSRKQKAAPQKRGAQPFIVCIGASAGGLNAILDLVSQFPADLNAAVFIVLHLSKASLGTILAEKIKQNTALGCHIARDKEKIQKGQIYIAPPDAHLLVKNDHILIGHGPAENRFRPSIDVLFRSAAAHFTERVIGVILTGMLNDGTNGMSAIKQSGGYCIVQDPNEAEYPDMPLSVLETIEVDYSVSLKKMGKVIASVIKGQKLTGIVPPPNILAESKLSEEVATTIEK